MEISYTPFKKEHTAPCSSIAATAPDPWSEADILSSIQAGHPGYGAIADGTPAGFCVFQLFQETAELSILAVSPAHRRSGIGESLLRHSFHQLIAVGATRCLLDVRVSNLAAIALYTKLGFRVLAYRPQLYSHPIEDGLTMELLFVPNTT
ncbi:MAG: GNAT family N-acetyltransferase [Oscillospiraceae bacterium]